MTQWQDNPSLAKFDWRAQYNYLEFNATLFTQKQYVLQATQTDQGRDLLSCKFNSSAAMVAPRR
ncbi:hypothetical protein J8L98_02345 [Pseudoalteromonas sp. MMG013]|uniref:hypothetical protein n=1 Tax=Pseudoalteromonas sp. MMG013 TaxID=2822687 RepID=UPI001B37B276|nr:hypothetical protein [Pseudoalteromonas sp. MMG013]MBQ4860533.1 hypothetical protein [Pseudoalteromonas sp. MMG013]